MSGIRPRSSRVTRGRLRAETGLNVVVLSGGVFLNATVRRKFSTD